MSTRLFVGSYFAGHVMGSRPMKRKTEKYIERYLNLADVSSYYLFSSKYIDIVKTTTFGNKTYEKKRIERKAHFVIFAVGVSIFCNTLIHKSLERRKIIKLN